MVAILAIGISRARKMLSISTFRTARLDDVIPDDFVCSFIKIDVEGAEYLVLSGARATLKRYHPTIWFEYGADSAGYFKSTSPQI